MFNLTLQQQRHALYWLVCLHICIITASNYLVQIPFEILGWNTTWGAFTFPFVFLTTDLTVRIFGATLARRIIFVVMLPALIISYAVSVLFFNGAWQGFLQLSTFSIFVFRIALASFLAYAFGQLLDILVFNRLRQCFSWWVAPATAAIAGNAIDTLIFFSTAFYKSNDDFMAANWIELGCLDYATKIVFCILFLLPVYGIVLKLLLQWLLKKQATQATIV